MKTLRLFGMVCVLGVAVTACFSSNAPTGVTPGATSQMQRVAVSALRAWMSPGTTQTELVYVSCTSIGEIAIKYENGTYIGSITDGISEPEGLATDNSGNLYVANAGSSRITIYQPGETSPSLTLIDPHPPNDVAVGSNGYVYASDNHGGIEVYAAGATSPTHRLANAALRRKVSGVGVDASNNVYATGFGPSGPAVVKFANGSGSGANLGLTGLKLPAGVIIDDNDNLILTDKGRRKILIYAPGQTSPSRTINAFVAGDPVHSALNKAENLIAVPQTDEYVAMFDYPSFKYVTIYTAGGKTLGAAVFP